MSESPVRRRVLAALALIVAVSMAATPAVAATGDVEFPPAYSACVGDAVLDAGFTDTVGNFAKASINCIAYYGITTGTTETTYSPSQKVTRAQMALFLTRAAPMAGITLPDPVSHGFTDIDTLPTPAQNAVNQLASLGITTGTSATTFGPKDVVSRYQMALFLVRFLELANGSAILPVGVSPSGMTDLDTVTVEAATAIEKAWDLGITKGTTETLFSPLDTVTRDQMAAFIARALDHTSTRPAGLTMQILPASGDAPLDVALRISLRDSAFLPMVDEPIDIFRGDLTTPSTLVLADGTCDPAVAVPVAGLTVCTVDLGDLKTNQNGDVIFLVADLAGPTEWWAWTGDLGTVFDSDLVQAVTATTAVTPAPTTTTTIPPP